MKYVSLFAGIGGFDLALKRLGHKCIYANEWDKYAAQTYDKNFSDPGYNKGGQSETEWEGMEMGRGLHFTSQRKISHNRIDTRDITAVPTSDIPDHDLLVGGFPCQAFSIAGKRRGFAETRGTLFFEIARILKDKKPSYFVLENVKGLLNHDNGNTFKTIISTLVELGYDLQWQVLNSKNFGVPQNRERVFIVGHLRGTPRPKVFPLCGTDKEIKESIASTAIDANYWKGADKHGQRMMIVSYPHGGFKGGEKKLPNLRSHSGAIHNETVNAIRRLTPVECERLQGFPDNWTEGVSDTQRYKQLGNAVTVNVVQTIVSKLPKQPPI